MLPVKRKQCTFSRLNGSYEALEYGFEADAFTDLTGGLAEWYNPADLKEEDFYLVRAAFQSGAVIGCLSVVSQSEKIQIVNIVSYFQMNLFKSISLHSNV